jgi:hypothetical protein
MRGGVLTQSPERSERVGVDRIPVHLHDRDVTVDVLSSGAAENVRTSALSDESTIGVDELGFRESGSATTEPQPLPLAMLAKSSRTWLWQIF